MPRVSALTTVPGDVPPLFLCHAVGSPIALDCFERRDSRAYNSRESSAIASAAMALLLSAGRSGDFRRKPKAGWRKLDAKRTFKRIAARFR
jgi:hypothetical protein